MRQFGFGLVLGGLAFSASGCSYIFVKTVPDSTAREVRSHVGSVKPPPYVSLQCTSGKAAPVIDTLIAGYQVVRTGVALSASDASYSGQPINREADIVLGLAFVTLFTASSVYGFRHTGECSELEGIQAGWHKRNSADDRAELERAGIYVQNQETRILSGQRSPSASPAAAPKEAPKLEQRLERARQRQQEAAGDVDLETRVERAKQRQQGAATAPDEPVVGAPKPDEAGAPKPDEAGAPKPDEAGAPKPDEAGAPKPDEAGKASPKDGDTAPRE
jgi:hypothetical protein